MPDVTCATCPLAEFKPGDDNGVCKRHPPVYTPMGTPWQPRITPSFGACSSHPDVMADWVKRVAPQASVLLMDFYETIGPRLMSLADKYIPPEE